MQYTQEIFRKRITDLFEIQSIILLNLPLLSCKGANQRCECNKVGTSRTQPKVRYKWEGKREKDEANIRVVSTTARYRARR